jgi:hypothetical protein
MNEQLFNKLATRGTHTLISVRELKAGELQELDSYFRLLKKQGHALNADETFEHTGESIGISITHLLTCRICCPKENQRGKIQRPEGKATGI